MTRQDRKFAKEVIDDAAQVMGLRRFQFMRRVNNGDIECTEELAAAVAVKEFDKDRFQEILNMILEFIKTFMAMIAPFFA